MISGLLFLSWRIFEILTLVPIVGMFGYFVHYFTSQNLLTPTYILVLFIVSVIALAWAVFTTIDYLRARHDAFFVALFDLGLVGALIAGVYYLRRVAGAHCTNANAGRTPGGFYISVSTDKDCAMLKASFALGIINIIAFFITFLLALLVARNHRNDDRAVVKREYRTTHHGSRHRSRSRDYRSSREYGYDRPSSSRRSHHSTSRRQYYV
ncbi:hypothetical protein EJ03DRAFT_112248 [Teratosphaeria nubilosa]|uniref:MARVEL domain-containing protein n=1 Tax=Teratosphaeria nubilosa TaxID=161662 RepID=A0A6G1L7J8_9PEZI|nr:hypothetical protein EJ03DRAFT_112248 [Teratosphaeria nubilosa]